MTPERENEMFERLIRIEDAVKGLPDRVSRLELWRAWTTGAVASIGAGVLFVIDKTIELMKH